MQIAMVAQEVLYVSDYHLPIQARHLGAMTSCPFTSFTAQIDISMSFESKHVFNLFSIP